jgi:hypothetical protein
LRESKATRAISHSIISDGGCHSTQRFRLPPAFSEDADVVLIGIEDSHTGVSLIEPTAFLEKPPRSIPRLSSEVNITIQVNELGNGAASLQLSTDRLVLYLFVSTEAEGRFSENTFHLRPYERKTIVFDHLEGCGGYRTSRKLSPNRASWNLHSPFYRTLSIPVQRTISASVVCSI